MTRRALHLCLPGFDNLGDRIAGESVPHFFQRHGVDLELDRVDILECKYQGRHLDERVPEINSSYDLVIIGPGGYLSLGLIDHIFSDTKAWARIDIPVVFLGVGLIANVGGPAWYTCIGRNDNRHLSRALQAASLISVRDLRSWLTASRITGNDSGRIFLTGCPTVNMVRQPGAPSPTHDILLNLPFHHDSCREHQNGLIKAARLLLANLTSVKWVCHSETEWDNARQLQNSLGNRFEVVYPRTIDEVRSVYASCRIGLVTKMHAGLFCFANRVPFGFLSYDMKCDALLEMIVDFPHDFSVHIDRLQETSMDMILKRIVGNLGRNHARIQIAIDNLSGMFDREAARFGSGMIELLQGPEAS